MESTIATTVLRTRDTVCCTAVLTMQTDVLQRVSSTLQSQGLPNFSNDPVLESMPRDDESLPVDANTEILKAA